MAALTLAPMSALIAERLRQRLRTNGSAPLLTYYDLGSGERTELSAISFGNWVDKTSNLLVDDVAVGEGDVIGMPLALEAPGHWLTAVWQLACWQVGLTVDLTDLTTAAAVVSGRRWQGYERQEVYACALHPLGFGFAEPLPRGVHDYAIEVRNYADRFLGAPPDPGATAWVDAERTLTQSDLIKIDGQPVRRLVRAEDPWATCRDGLVTALVTGGSAVIVVGRDIDQLTRIAESERVVTRNTT
jgi:uncharacterized protein (TIGR03089 family)